ncbi:hypothetical protein HIM_03491 [Hirsutella minnesotensis 3608]|uniref:Uncharacterized protein n=1 Tax=Hirsutella minnesotensis 3608 TaxID=1043627 RepID=A0A0F7ZQF7_9HYPO|nr:hypothetical protein HIM_03491 [Hirsutella minnesotensis 3608]
MQFSAIAVFSLFAVALASPLADLDKRQNTPDVLPPGDEALPGMGVDQDTNGKSISKNVNAADGAQRLSDDEEISAVA